MTGLILEIAKFRGLVQALVARYVATRYRGSFFGFLWSFMNPLCLMVVYTIVFNYYMRFDNQDHYHLNLFVGLLPWIWSASALVEGTSSIVSSGHLVTKSMFPAHLLPLASVLSSGVNFVLSLPVLAIFFILARSDIYATILLLPFLIFLHTFLLYGAVLSLSALNVFYRDIQHIIGNLLTFIFFLCPIVYPASIVPARFRFLIDLNPVAIIIEMYRDLILRGRLPSFDHTILVVAFTGVVFLLGGMVYDCNKERFAEAL